MNDNKVTDQMIQSALRLIECRYQEIIDVNFSTKSSEVIWLQSEDNFNDIDQMCRDGKISSNEARNIRKFHNIQYIRTKLLNKSSISAKFRYKFNNNVEWMQVEVIKNADYAASNVHVYIFIKNIEDSYGKEYRARKDAEKIARTDALTGYLNRFAFDRFCKSCKYSSIGLVYIDLNNLKNVNDTQGHAAGDEYIRSCCAKIDAAFQGFTKYRIGGDEFIVISLDTDFDAFTKAIHQFSLSINQNISTMPICSLGYTWTDDSNAFISDLVGIAEKKMYRCKEFDYLRFNQDRRRYDRRHNI